MALLRSAAFGQMQQKGAKQGSGVVFNNPQPKEEKPAAPAPPPKIGF